jgi:hypothetical protein
MFNDQLRWVRLGAFEKPHQDNRPWFTGAADWMGTAESEFPGGLKISKPNTEINPFQVDRKTSNTEKVKLHSTDVVGHTNLLYEVKLEEIHYLRDHMLIFLSVECNLNFQKH